MVVTRNVSCRGLALETAVALGTRWAGRTGDLLPWPPVPQFAAGGSLPGRIIWRLPTGSIPSQTKPPSPIPMCDEPQRYRSRPSPRYVATAEKELRSPSAGPSLALHFSPTATLPLHPASQPPARDSSEPVPHTAPLGVAAAHNTTVGSYDGVDDLPLRRYGGPSFDWECVGVMLTGLRQLG